jgi:hypothetical protein
MQDVKIENLQTQLEYLNLLRLRHLQWMSSASDSRIEGLHSSIVEQIQQITDQYSGLLGKLQQ